MTRPSQRAAIYARVSSQDQDLEPQLHQLRRYVHARRWTAVEYVDTGEPGGARITARPSTASFGTPHRGRSTSWSARAWTGLGGPSATW